MLNILFNDIRRRNEIIGRVYKNDTRDFYVNLSEEYINFLYEYSIAN